MFVIEIPICFETNLNTSRQFKTTRCTNIDKKKKKKRKV